MLERMAPASERLLHLDVLRGFALLGILLVNFQFFARPILSIALGADPDLSGASLLVDWLIMALAEGKFYALFSMLFGAGFALMAERAARNDTPFWGLYLRRLLILLLFGLCHMFLVWAGDILVVYSVCAFLMVLLFRNTPVQRLWKWAVGFFVLPIFLLWLGALSIAATQADPEVHQNLMAEFEADELALLEQLDEAARIQNEGSWRDNVGQRSRDARFLVSTAFFWVPSILGFFLLGRWLLLSQRLSRPQEHQMFFRRWRSRGLLLGLPLALLGTSMLYQAVQITPTLSLATGISLTSAGAIFLSLAYLSMIILNAERLAFLAPAGQMALSNYLAQSLFWTWTLYGHGLGLGPMLPRWSHLFLAVGFFAVQLVFSHWWMARYRFGPAEWLWRSLTYLSWQPMRRAAD
ncbi:MAG: DUF418 domain-containing protein [Wenzhouxiangella sp.]